jgi:hypothetical protein
MCVAMCTGLLVLFRKRFNRQRSFGNFLSANAYTVYIVHPFVIVGLAYGLHTSAGVPKNLYQTLADCIGNLSVRDIAHEANPTGLRGFSKQYR